ncbi:glycerate dehydrogenase HprA (plasmid) [Cupriavidus necator N-1]|uniref:Glycerate dehydrogenase HprA n=1 Tax=Cupriavidus necator (strain ATCC 43291 / DSM 13513 / CCUG 52238 / LMG 8453 / N-1) TaxID=1042878 RepID=F8GUM0_CUPNN|nr:D-2-hydroxyacid dehydrogenase [Cupriavidus necator]AEI82424.1 glycerate dehydrogenase HprA [Cupriavidus necator N-1]MDX6007434.1 D-2-hydroxyacid dehydrogenase [Cupriavidus necator]
MKIVFLDRSTISPQTTLKTLPFSHQFVFHDETAEEDVAGRIADADVVITNKVKLSGQQLQQAPNLKLIAVAATGTDIVDLKACASRGIVVSNIRNYAVHTVPEHTFALIFALRRSLTAYHDSVRSGRWQQAGTFCYFDYPIKDLHGSVLGIIGDGVLGQSVAAIARALGIQPLFATYKGRQDMGPLYTPFEEVMRRSDIITLHCPLTPQTRDVIDTPEFEMMERRPLLINTARGGLVNESALVDALKSGKVGGAGFDVATQEPPGVDHPFHQLKDTPNFILTPHVAWASDEAVQGLADQLIDNIIAFARGTPRNVVV